MIYGTHLCQARVAFPEATMHDEHFATDDRTELQGPERGSKAVVHHGVELLEYLIHEPSAALGFHCVHVLVFVIAPVYQDTRGLREEVRKEEQEYLGGVR